MTPTKKEKLLNLANRIEVADSFRMKGTGVHCDDCTAPGCIAGHAFAMKEGTLDIPFEASTRGCSFFDEMGEYLELSQHESHELFHPQHETATFRAGYGEKGYISKAAAVICLRRFAETNAINWYEAQLLAEDSDYAKEQASKDRALTSVS